MCIHLAAVLPARRLSFALAVAFVLIACLPTDPCACTLPPPEIVVHGTALDEDDAPQPGVHVRAAAGPTCGEMAFPPAETNTDVDGDYELTIFTYSGLCVRVEAIRSHDVVADTVVVDTALHPVGAADRFRVDLVFPAAP